VYLFVFSINPITIEPIAPEGAVFVICPMIALTIRAVHPVRAGLALKGGWDRWLAIRVASAAACKLMMGVLVVEFTASGAYRYFLRAMFVGMSPLPVLPALPAKWSPY
jgi:hypothetical protein